MIKKLLEDVNEFFGVCNRAVEGDAAVLIKNGVAGGLEEHVSERVALGDFFLDLCFEVVVGVLGFPETVLEGEGVDEGAVRTERLLACAAEVILLDEVPAVRSAAGLEEVGEGGAGVAFGGVAVLLELREDGLVVLDRGVRWL